MLTTSRFAANFTPARGNWAAWACIALLPLWLIGMFGRGYWTPDEPREADIAWRMTQQADLRLPQLGDQLFLEKPPLSYWLSAASMNVFGASPAAARLPNLLYAAITVLAIGALAWSIAGYVAGLTAAWVTGSAFTAYQVSIWLAPDACLLAGCALALWGLFRGYVAEGSRQKLLWYCLMHVGATIGFMAKSGPGWIYPALTLLVLVAWEQRWRELLRWQLWSGFAIQVLCIGGWMWLVWREPNGDADLRVLLWNNLVGRFTDVHASGALDYTAAHQNWPGKYLVEFFYDLFPWSLLVIAALFRALTRTREPSARRTAWRCTIASSVPFIFLLSFAATARSIYMAPAILGFGLLTGLWASEWMNSEQPAGRVDQFALRCTRYLIGAVACMLSLVIFLIALIPEHRSAAWYELVGILLITSVAYALNSASKNQHRGRPLHSFALTVAAFVLCVGLGGYALNPLIDSGQNLGALARAITIDNKDDQLAAINPDETTIAMMDYQLHASLHTLDGDDAQIIMQAGKWFAAHPTTGRILVMLPGHAPSQLLIAMTHLMSHLKIGGVQQKPSDGELTVLEKAHAARLIARYELPNGRRYAVVGPADSAPAS